MICYHLIYSIVFQLKKAIGPNSLPFFPPKKILPLTLQQKEERRAQLEKYIQISQLISVNFLLYDSLISSDLSLLFNNSTPKQEH